MLRISTIVSIVMLAVLPGCKTVQSTRPIAIVAEAADANDWHVVASTVDAARIGKIAASWESALADVRSRVGRKAVTNEGALLDPAAALPRPAPPPGVYHCRVVRLGLTPINHTRALESFKPFYCYVAVEGALLTFTKGDGTHRPGGRLWDDSDTRLVFLGSVSDLPDGPLPAYGDNPMSNQVGIVERIGDFRWRMVLPGSSREAKLDVMELTPVAPPLAPVRQGALR